VAEILDGVGDAGLVMYHDAYGYLATAFGLNVLGTIALGDAADPGAARLSAIRASLREVPALSASFPR
jgi:zinc transport system substrate-binding protein